MINKKRPHISINKAKFGYIRVNDAEFAINGIGSLRNNLEEQAS